MDTSPAAVTRRSANSLTESRAHAAATRSGCWISTWRLNSSANVMCGMPLGGTAVLIGDPAPWSSQSGPSTCCRCGGQSARSYLGRDRVAQSAAAAVRP